MKLSFYASGLLIWIFLTWGSYATNFWWPFILSWGIWTIIGIGAVYLFFGQLAGSAADNVIQTEIAEGVKRGIREYGAEKVQ